MRTWLRYALVVLLSALVFGAYAIASNPTITRRNVVSRSGDTMTGTLTLAGAAAPALDVTGVASGSSAIRLADGQRITWGSDLMLTDSASRFQVLVGTNFSSDIDVGAGIVLETDLNSDRTTATFSITSDTTAATMSTTVAAITLAPTATPDANDLILEVNSAAAASLFTVDLEGDVVLLGDLNSDVTTSTFDITSDTTAATMSTTVAAITFAPTATPDANDLLLELNDAAGSTLFSVDLEGDVFLSSDLNSDITGSSFDITSDTNAATATSVGGAAPVAAITLAPTATLDASDSFFALRNAAGGVLFDVDIEGDVFAANGQFWGRTSAATMSTTVAGVQISTLATPDANDLIFAVARGPTAGYRFTVDDEGDGVFTGNLDVGGTGSVTTCTLDGASPSVCTATVVASSTCVCANVGTTAAIANNGCAVSLSGTTLTVTSANAAGNVVNIHCF